MVDEHYGITKKAIAGLDELGDDFESYLAQQKKNSYLDIHLDSAISIMTE